MSDIKEQDQLKKMENAQSPDAAEVPKEFVPRQPISDDEKDFVRQASRMGMAGTEMRLVIALARLANMPVMDYQANVWMDIKMGAVQVLTQETTGIIQQ